MQRNDLLSRKENWLDGMGIHGQEAKRGKVSEID